MGWFLIALKKYAVFSGRARRREYWYFVLFAGIVSTILTIWAFGPFYAALLASPGAASTIQPAQMAALINPVAYWILVLYSLALLLPSLGVTIRRLHDTGRTGWWIFISLVPLVGGIVLLVFYCLDSQPGTNKWGPNPKGVEFASAEPATLI